MKPHELPAEIRRTGPAPLYLVAGEEAYFRDQAVATIRAAVIKESQGAGEGEGDGLGVNQGSGFNDDVLYADETDASEILAYAQEVSFFSARRIIVVKWIEKLPTREGEALIPYLQSPMETTTLIFVGTKLDGRLKWAQTLKKNAVVVDCAPLYENQRLAWVKKQASEMSVQLDASGLHALTESATEGLYVTKGELDKLVGYLPSGTCATANHVETLRGKEPGASVFDLAGAIGSGQCGWALQIVAKNIDAGEAPLRILGALTWQVRRLWKAKSLLTNGSPQPQVARLLGIPPFRAAEFFRQVHQWSDGQLSKAWEMFWESDSALKGGSATAPRRVLDGLVLSLCEIPEKKKTTGEGVSEKRSTLRATTQRGTRIRSGRA